MQCEFCSKEYTNKRGYSNHVRRCPINPNRIHESSSLTKESRKKLSDAAKENNAKKWANLDFRKKHQDAMKRAVLKNPGLYSSSNRGRTKQIIVDDIKLQGQWEVDFYLWAKTQGLELKRPAEAFRYEWNGLRWYYPDFYIKLLDLYVEVKGYETDRDREKWSQFPKKLRIIKEKEITQIRKGCFKGL